MQVVLDMQVPSYLALHMVPNSVENEHNPEVYFCSTAQDIHLNVVIAINHIWEYYVGQYMAVTLDDSYQGLLVYL